MRYWLFALLLPVTLLAKSWVHGESVTASYHDQHLEVVFALQAGDTLLEQGLAIVAADNQVQWDSILLPEPLTIKKAGIDVQGYQGQLTAYLPLTADTPHSGSVDIHYQICNEICYPPQQIRMAGPIEEGAPWHLVSTPSVKKPPVIKAAPANKTSSVSLPQPLLRLWLMFFLCGLMMSLTPCAIPVWPIVANFVPRQRSQRLHVLAMVSGIMIVFSLIGLIVALTGSYFTVWQSTPIRTVLALLLLFVATMMLSPPNLLLHLHATILNRERSYQHPRSSILMGSIIGLLASPCLTPPLFSSIVLASQLDNIMVATTGFAALGLGFSVPLVLVITIGQRILQWFKPAVEFIELGIALAIWTVAWILLFAKFTTPLFVLALMTFAILMLLLSHEHRSQGFQRVTYTIACVLFALALILMISSPASPHLKSSSHGQMTVLKTHDELQTLFTTAPPATTVVMVTADWCLSCLPIKAQLKSLMMDPELAGVRWLIIDVTAEDHEVRTLLKAHQVLGPPTLVVMTPSTWDQPFILVGEVSSAALKNQLLSTPASQPSPNHAA